MDVGGAGGGGAVMFNSIDVVLVRHFARWRWEQYRFPRSRRRRIRKKWARDRANYRNTYDGEQGPYRMGDRILCGPRAYAKILAAAEASP